MDKISDDIKANGFAVDIQNPTISQQILAIEVDQI